MLYSCVDAGLVRACACACACACVYLFITLCQSYRFGVNNYDEIDRSIWRMNKSEVCVVEK